MSLKGLIYCRVSSKRQVNEGNGLSSQEKRCRDYASNTLGVEIEKVFNDEGVSGGVFERKSIKELLKYIDNNKKSNYVVIFEDLNRLSRDIQVHNLLKAEFRKRGVELACPNFQFENSPEGTFRENMSVSMAQYEKDKNRQRVNDRMRARLEQGFWCFKVPIGYKYTKNSKGGKEIFIDEKEAKIVKLAFEKFANNELKTVNDVVRFFHLKGIKAGTVKNGKVYSNYLVHRLLRNILYTGFLEFPNWGIGRIKAKHKAIISLKLFEKVQNKLNGFKNDKEIFGKIELNENRIDRSEDFPLR